MLYSFTATLYVLLHTYLEMFVPRTKITTIVCIHKCNQSSVSFISYKDIIQ